MSTLNIVWPALYVSETYWRFWFLIIVTIVIEAIPIKYSLHFSWGKSLFASVIGNMVSGGVGMIVMPVVMLVWHHAIDHLLPGKTFDQINWIATYFLMFLGSAIFELLVIFVIYRVRVSRLIVPFLAGNFFSYLFIAVFLYLGL